MIRNFSTILMVIFTMVLFGCGGSGGSSSGTITPAVTAKTITGVAATGTPIAGTIYLKDSSTPTVQLSTPIAADGSYSFDVTNLTAPYMLKAIGTANSQNYTLYSMAGAPGVANVNPLTHLAVTRANGGTDPAAIFVAMTPAQVQALQAAIATAISQIQAIIQPIMAQYNIPTNTDFIAAPYTANHTGLDLLFDMVAIAANNGTMTVTNKTNGAPVLTTVLNGTTLSGTVTTGNLPAMPTKVVGAVYVYTLTPVITVGGTATFNAIVLGVANQSVIWSVVESGGGSITSAGVYTASATAGTYHIKATSVADATQTATVAEIITSTANIGGGGGTTIPISGLLGGAIQGKTLSLTGTAAKIATTSSYTNGITTDGTNLFYTDGSSICQMNIATGVITTLAGVVSTSGSVDGTGTAARFLGPYDLTIVGPYLYVLDGNNGTIRKLEISTGKVTTFAGQTGVIGHTDGTGTAAVFSEPFGITNDGTNLYVTDNGCIRKVEIATAKVTTIAGVSTQTQGHVDGTGTAARFGQIIGITTDGTNLYVVDPIFVSGAIAMPMAGTIRKIVISTGEVTTIAGSTTVIGTTNGIGTAATFSYPSSITTDGVNLYITEQGASEIRKIVISTGEVSKVASGLFGGGGITTDGNAIYTVNAAIYKIN